MTNYSLGVLGILVSVGLFLLALFIIGKYLIDGYYYGYFAYP